jgi:hypothetical protein
MRGQTLDEALERHLRVGCPSPMVKNVPLPKPLVAKRVRVIPRSDVPNR